MQGSNLVKKLGNSIVIKLMVIGFLIALLMIPVEMVKGVISERLLLKQSAVREVSGKWGGEQYIAGPILSIPFKVYSKNDRGVSTVRTDYAHFLPETLNIEGVMQPDVRHRGIYEVILYSSEVQISAVFDKLRWRDLGVDEKDVLWDRAVVSVGIPDLRGLKNMGSITWNQDVHALNPGIESTPFSEAGVSVQVPLSGQPGKNTFRMKANINGSGQMNFYPMGKVTRVQLASSWPSPSFTGAFLPDTRAVSSKGFEAKWEILHVNRNYPQQWIGKNEKVSESSFGARLFYPVDQYQQSIRSAKYAILFIVLTFITFFLTEVINKNRLHPIQYLLVGFAICIFYILLISISEHATFGLAYLISAAASILLVTLYSRSILKSVRLSILVGCLLMFLYAFLFVTLQLEDYALLMGSIGLLIVLGVVMYVTRATDWYAFAPAKSARQNLGDNGDEEMAK